MAAYKTPGVYIKEIAVFPPSVAQVATAIPAFIGYTEKAIKDGEDVSFIPTRIDSLPDVRETFGGAPPQDDFRTYLDDELRVTKVEIKPKYFMFDSLQLFYENGGGACYIVSVGSYQDTVDLPKLKDGLKKLEKVDEPTLILFPDACLLSSAAELSNIQVATLAQCVKLQDRFGVFDLKEDPSAANPNWEAGRDAFRDGVGVNGLKYGAAYTPWLKVRYEKQVSLDKLTLVQAKNDQEIALAKLTTDPDLSQMIAAAMTAIQDRNTVDANIAAISTPESTLRDKYNTLVSVVILADAEVEDKFKEIFVFLKSIAKTADDWVNSDAKKLGTASHASLRTEVNNVIRDSLSGSLKSLIGYYKGGIQTATDGPGLTISLGTDPFKLFEDSASPWDLTVANIGQDVSI